MVELRILSGKRAGTSWVARRFPVRVGRAPKDNLQLEEDGVWDQHCQLQLSRTEGFLLLARPEAPALVNGHPAERVLLRSGDLIQLGSVKLQFWLSANRQAALGLREWLTWIGIAGICLGQVGLIYWLLR